MGEPMERDETLDWELVSVPRWALEEVNNLAGSHVMQVPSRSPRRRELIAAALQVTAKAIESDPAAFMDEVREVIASAKSDYENYFGIPVEKTHWTSRAAALLARMGRE